MNDTADAPVDLTNCDREAIHIPGAILPHGAMLVADPQTMTIEQVAGDTAGLLGHPAPALAGQSLAAVFSAEQVARLQELLNSASLARSRHLLDPLMRVRPERPIDASVHLSGGALVIEVEDADLADRQAVDPLACVQDMFDRLGDAPDLQGFCQLAAERVRAVAGYDRVMVYRFMPDDSGWVLAEARREDVAPFLRAEKAPVCRIADRAFHALAGADALDDQEIDPQIAQQVFDVGGVEDAAGGFRDHDVVRRGADLGDHLDARLARGGLQALLVGDQPVLDALEEMPLVREARVFRNRLRHLPGAPRGILHVDGRKRGAARIDGARPAGATGGINGWNWHQGSLSQGS